MFILILGILFSPLLVVMLIGFLSGWNGYETKNGFSNFVNSNRWSDNK